MLKALILYLKLQTIFQQRQWRWKWKT